jgi:vacuolar-type H+-ATPase subunit D/Vma8
MASDIEVLKKKRDQLTARIQQAEIRKRSSDSKADTAVKVLVGAAVLNSIKNGSNPESSMARLMVTLQSFLTRDRDINAVLGSDKNGSDAFKRLTQKEKPESLESVTES